MSTYKFNFADLSRLMDDFFFLFQKGGRGIQLLKSKGNEENTFEKIIRFTVIAFKLVISFVVLYTFYIIIFRGYPRIGIDLITFKFFNKVKLDEFIKERNLLINQFKFLTTPSSSCLTPFTIYQSIYGPTNLGAIVNQFEQQKDIHYTRYKYDDKYHNAFKEYFLLYNKVDKIDPHDVWYKTNKVLIQEYPFYELLLTYRMEQGEIQKNNTERGGNKGDDQLLYEFYKKEQMSGFKSIKAVKTIKATLRQLSDEVKNMTQAFTNLPVIAYVVVPENDIVITSILKDVSKIQKQIVDKTVYNVPYDQIGDYSWYIIEYLLYLSDKDQYTKFVQNMPAYTNEDLNKIIYYLNLPRQRKATAEKRIMNYSRNAEFFEYIKKHPVFSHIHFAVNVSNKSALYGKVMDTYKLLSDCSLGASTQNIDINHLRTRLNNLQENAYLLKRLITTVTYLNLFLNEYQKSITYMYEKQIISNKRFFRELWLPFVDDIVKNRIGNYFKRVFSSQGMGSSWKKFNKWYEQLGKELKRMTKAVFKAFFTSTPIEQPQAVDTSDNTPE